MCWSQLLQQQLQLQVQQQAWMQQGVQLQEAGRGSMRGATRL
jgi:hypothetical protein